MKSVDRAFTYDTYRRVVVKDKKIAILYNIMQVAIIFYVLAYRIQLKEYHKIKVKNMGRVKAFYDGKIKFKNQKGQTEVYDSGDLNSRVTEDNQIFVTTMVITIDNQKIGQCDSIPCRKNRDCPFDPPLKLPKCIRNNCEVHLNMILETRMVS